MDFRLRSQKTSSDWAEGAFKRTGRLVPCGIVECVLGGKELPKQRRIRTGVAFSLITK